jgi:hypothetical protein
MEHLGCCRWPCGAGVGAEMSAFLELVTHSSSGLQHFFWVRPLGLLVLHPVSCAEKVCC